MPQLIIWDEGEKLFESTLEPDGLVCVPTDPNERAIVMLELAGALSLIAETEMTPEQAQELANTSGVTECQLKRLSIKLVHDADAGDEDAH